ncbi:MAG: tetratricopeptide repeat protein [Bacteroidia bacterium]
MKRCGSFLFCLFFFVPSLLLAQSFSADSIKIALAQAKTSEQKLVLLNKLSAVLSGLNPDSAEYYANRALALARRMENKKEEALALKHLGWALSKQGDDQKAIGFYREGAVIAKEINDKIAQGEIYRSIGAAQYHFAEYDSALANYFIALELFKAAKDTTRFAGVLNNIGTVYYFTRRDSLAAQYYTEALEIYKRTEDEIGLAKQYGNLGLLYIRAEDTFKAIEYSVKSLEYYLETNEQAGIATSYLNLGVAYEQADKFDKALENVNKSLEIRTKLGDKRGIAVATAMVANVFFESKQYSKAIEHYKIALPLCKEVKLKAYIFEMMNNMATSYKELGKYREAANLYPQLMSIKDSIYNIETSEQISGLEAKYKAEMEAQYETQKKDNEIKLLTQEAEIQNLSLKRRSTYLWAAAGFIILLWVILGISYNAYRSKQKTNAVLEKKNKEISRQKEEITDSINYAQTIQRAILPPEKLLQKYLPDSFVIFRPKDIVSGDFYWTANSQLVYFAAVDCTGHGVPGAFMSIIGHNSLNRAVKDFKLTHPAEILDKLVELVTEALRAENQTEVKDGMDIALCCLDTQQMKLEYAGAYNPLYVIRKGEVLEYKADRQPIGAFEKRLPFTNHVIELQKDDCIYVFSDGVADQFGGEKGKKLGTKRLKEWLVAAAHLPASEQYTQLNTRLTQWQGTEEQTDDVTLIGVRV